MKALSMHNWWNSGWMHINQLLKVCARFSCKQDIQWQNLINFVMTVIINTVHLAWLHRMIYNSRLFYMNVILIHFWIKAHSQPGLSVKTYLNCKEMTRKWSDGSKCPHFLCIVLKVMLHEMICNNGFKRNTALECWNNIATIRFNVATML